MMALIKISLDSFEALKGGAMIVKNKISILTTEFQHLFDRAEGWTKLGPGTDPALFIVHTCQGMSSDPEQIRPGTRNENCLGQYFFDPELARMPGPEKCEWSQLNALGIFFPLPGRIPARRRPEHIPEQWE